MKATLRRRFGSPQQITLEEVPQPIPATDEVLVKVHATTVNRTDCANLTAQPFIMRFVLGLRRPRQPILGTDFAGEVVEVGKGVTSLQVGDKVFGFNDTSMASQAEYLASKANQVYRIPAGIDYPTAAASLEGAHYAYAFLERVNIQSGQRILINGATGAIGSALLQFIRPYDVHITATANTPNLDRIRALGADELIDYTQEDFTQRGASYDFIFDTVGKSSFAKCKKLLTPKGIYISSEAGPMAQNVWLTLWTKLTRKKVLFPVPFKTEQSIPFIIKHLEQGVFTPLIDRSYALDDIVRAYEYVLTGQKVGNVVVRVVDEGGGVES